MNKLNLGCGKSLMPDAVNLDKQHDDPSVVLFDLEMCAHSPLPFPDNNFDKIYMSHVFEHITNTMPLMQELWRVAKPNCGLFIRLPYGSSDNAWEDPTHVRPYFLDSFGYFSQVAYGGSDYGYRGDWATNRRILKIVRPEFHTLKNDLDSMMSVVMLQRNVVDEYLVFLHAVKPARQPGIGSESSPVEFFFPTTEE